MVMPCRKMQQPKEYEELTLDNYPTWASDIKIAFAARGILGTITPPVENGPQITQQMTYNALLMLRTSIHKDLKREYLFEENPLTLWTSLKNRYEQQKDIIYPDEQHEWNHLRIQDFKSVADYNHAVHNIYTKLRFCGKEPTDAEKIHKTLSTMHPSDRVLCNQYRKEQHQVYSQLILSLTQAEKYDELLLKNHHLRPVGSAPLPAVHNVQNNAPNNKWKFNGPPPGNPKNSTGRHGRKFNKNRRHKANKRACGNAPPPNGKERMCHKCGCNTHYAATSRTPKHLVDLYLKSIRENKQKESRYEAHFNQTTDDKKAGVLSLTSQDSPNNQALTQNVDIPPALDDMLIEYGSNDMYGDLV